MDDYFLADDLSGALDAAAAFHRTGRRVRIALRPDAWDEAAPDEVVAITTETRNVAPAEAASAVAAVLAAGQARGAQLLYKKIDSTLRGPVAAEVGAVAQALPDHRILLAPANPRVGRTVRGGLLLVNGVPVAETAFGRDPASPLQTSVVRAILGAAALDRVAIPDTASEAELRAAVETMDAAGPEWIGVGSGALAVAVAARLPAVVRLSAGHEHEVPVSPVLMIGGSAHPLNREQCRELTRLHGVPVHELEPGAEAGVAAAAAESLRRGSHVALLSPAVRTTADAALRTVVDASVATIEAAAVRRVFATGGETAFALCERLGVRTLAFLEEIEPGLVLAEGHSRVGAILLAVKPGGFGDTQTWIRAWERLRRE